MPEQRLGERGVHAGHRLVQHQHRRVAHQGARHLQQLPLTAGQAARIVVALLEQLEAFEQVIRLRADLLLASPPAAPEDRAAEPLPGLILRPEQHVVQHGHRRQRLGQLKGAHHPGLRHPIRARRCERLPLEYPLRFDARFGRLVGDVESGDQVEEGGLACSVRSDQRRDRPTLDLEMVDVDGRDPPESPGDVVDGEHRIRLGRPGELVDGRESSAQLGPVVRVVVALSHRTPTPSCCPGSLVVGRSPTASGRRRR